MIIPVSSSWPMWARVGMTLVAVGVFGAMLWRYVRMRRK
jgi:hypothetical protein